jgi:hypothetical protein
MTVPEDDEAVYELQQKFQSLNGLSLLRPPLFNQEQVA